MNEHVNVLIIAGGSGTRLYPRSREDSPKQFIKTVGDKTLFQQTHDRMKTLVPQEKIFISTSDKFVSLVQEQVGEIKKENVFSEPLRKNTAAPIILSAALIAKKDPEALIVSMWSDSLVLEPAPLLSAINVGIYAIEKNPDSILIVACRPTSPHIGYGYIEAGELLEQVGVESVYFAKGFKEKPDRQTALEYLKKGNYFWNSGGHFIWKAQHMLDLAKKFAPEIYAGVQKIAQAEGTKDFEKVRLEEFSKFPDVAIEPTILEKTEKLLVIPESYGWSDVGSWETIVELVDPKLRDENGNYIEGMHIGIDTHNTNIFDGEADKLIATIGLNNIDIVTTKDVILVMENGRGQEVKKVVEEIKKRKLDNLL